MPNDYEVNVILTEHPTHWAWKVKCLGQFVASGSAVSLERALRIARQYSKEDGYEFGRLKLIGKSARSEGGDGGRTLPLRAGRRTDAGTASRTDSHD